MHFLFRRLVTRSLEPTTAEPLTSSAEARQRLLSDKARRLREGLPVSVRE
jgi:hypothetical protein